MNNDTKTTGNKERASATSWSRDDEVTLVRALRKAKEDGKWCDNNPKEAAWTFCVGALSGSEKVSGGVPKEIKAIRRKWQSLKREYDLLKNMRGQF